MKTAFKSIETTVFSALLLVFFMACEEMPKPVSDQKVVNSSLKLVEENDLMHVVSLDGFITLTFTMDDFNRYNDKDNLLNSLRIEKRDFFCQKDTYFSDVLWILQPADFVFDQNIRLTINYTHEEFAPEFNVQNLKMYHLKRDYLSQDDNKDPRLFRVSDMYRIDTCEQNENDMTVSTEISHLGAYVLGRKVN